jgi:CheY-like chemotaxis protein
MQGYTVLEAEHAEAALEICAAYTGEIDLLITDVVMPGLGGRDLAERVVHMRPDIKIIYISGYTDDAIVQHGVLRDDVRLVQKPFTPSVLAKHVRQVLDG